MSAISMTGQAIRWNWLRSPRFDLAFILGLPAIGIATGLFVTWQPDLFWPILVFDLWFLGYHHVVSTYTRLCFDRKSFSEMSRFLVFGLLPLVALATIALAFAVGLWAIVSIYFYWQWFHYARQSWGISRAYRGQGTRRAVRGRLDRPGDLLRAARPRHSLPLLSGPAASSSVCR